MAELLLALWIIGVLLVFGGIGWMLYKKSKPKPVPDDRGVGPPWPWPRAKPRDGAPTIPDTGTGEYRPPTSTSTIPDGWAGQNDKAAGSWGAPSSRFKEPSYAITQVFYATDRSFDFVPPSGRRSDGRLILGTCDVSIPRDHRLGQLEHPSIWKLEFRDDPEKHVVVLEVRVEDEPAFWKKLADRARKSSRGEAFVFVHGYDTTFEDSVRRTAQIAYDLGFDGAPICYSWPSYGQLADYAKDENNVQWTIPHLKNFLHQLTKQLDVRTVHVIAHSMGNRAVSYALQRLAAEDTTKLCHMQHIVLTAPDIDADTFRELARAVQSLAYKVTLYISPVDRALAISKRFHGNPRLGEAISIFPGIDTIDASGVDTSFIGHSYYAENRSVLSDIFWLLKEGRPPQDRFGMRAIVHGDGTYYAFRP
jgi:esterase/lipase superfamily enzyme